MSARSLAFERFPGMASDLALCDCTTWRVGGPAVALRPGSRGELADALGVLGDEGVPWFVLGRGSNVLAPDSGYDGVVIILSGVLAGVAWQRSDSGFAVDAGAAAPLPPLAGAACMKGAGGLAFAAGIPGTVGGAACMNAGAYGSSLSGLVESVEAVGPGGTVRIFPACECRFGYRSSSFQAGGWVVSGVRLSLPAADPALLRAEAADHLRRRRETLPLDMPNAGSVFKRPPDDKPPGRLIEEAGLKGLSCGGAMVSRKHANFIVNTGEAASADIVRLIEIIRERVEAASGTTLVEEIVYMGGRDLCAREGAR